MVGSQAKCQRSTAHSTTEPKNNRSMMGEISGRTNWNTKIFGKATQPSVPYFGRNNVSPCFQKDCSVPTFPLDLWHTGILLEARRHVCPSEVRHTRLGGLAEY